MNNIAKIETLATGNILIKVLVKHFDLQNASMVRSTIKHIIDEDEHKNFIFDLSGVESMDSTGISILAMTYNGSKKKGFQVFLLNVNPKIMQILTLSSMSNFFKIGSDLTSIDK